MEHTNLVGTLAGDVALGFEMSRLHALAGKGQFARLTLAKLNKKRATPSVRVAKF